MVRKTLILMFALVFVSVLIMPTFADEFLCNSCAECNSAITATSPGDTVKLNRSINSSGEDCIFFDSISDIIFDCDGYTITGDDNSEYGYTGISLYESYGSDRNIIRNCIISNFRFGVRIESVLNNTFVNISATSNYVGINPGQMAMTENNTIVNSTLYDNIAYDLDITTYCIDDGTPTMGFLINVTGSGGYPIEHYYGQVNISNQTFSELILHNADGSNINNVTIRGSDTLQNNEFYIICTENSTFININSSGNFNGIEISPSGLPKHENNIFRNVTTNSNKNMGFFIGIGCWNNTIINLSSSSNEYGFYLDSQYDEESEETENKIINSTLSENTIYDIDNGFSCIPDAQNYVINVTGSGGYPIGYYYGQVNLSNQTFSELIICNADGSNLYNITIRGSDTLQNNYFFIANTRNSIFRHINSSGNSEGIWLYYKSDYNTFEDVIVNSNLNCGLNFYNSFNATFNRSVINYNKYGIMLEPSSNHTIDNSIISYNWRAFHIYKNSYNNTIKNSRIENNSDCGVYFQRMEETTPLWNLFYNNIFNNSNNLNVNGSIWENFGDQPVSNYWNTTLDCTQTNIMGRQCIGGNYWTAPTGYGFSDICNDTTGDYICEETYQIEYNNTDFYPLWRCEEDWTCGEWSLCEAGTQTRTCTDSRSCNSIYLRPSLTQSCGMTGGPSSSSGSSTSSTTTTNNGSDENQDSESICTSGEKRCSNYDLQVCENSIWYLSEVCKDGCDNNTLTCKQTTVVENPNIGTGDNQQQDDSISENPYIEEIVQKYDYRIIIVIAATLGMFYIYHKFFNKKTQSKKHKKR